MNATHILEPLSKELNQLFDGDMQLAAESLDKLLYMLFFVDREVFSNEEVTTRAYELKQIISVLREISAAQA